MDIKQFFDNLTSKQIEDGNKQQFDQNLRFYNDFKAAFKKGVCFLCKQDLTEFTSSQPCFHWFLRPHGIKKKHFNKYLSTPIGFFRFDSYIRWVANHSSPFKNINDLKSEMNQSKLIEYTARYKNIEWSISISRTDRFGHINTSVNFPHFHFQMKIDGLIFIKYNDFHIPLSEEDIFTFRALEEAPDKVIWTNSFGEGMSIIEDQELLEKLDKKMIRTEDFENATFNTSTLFQMPESQTINGELLNQILEESRETGIPIRHLMKKYFPEANIITEISPGNGVPDIAARSQRK